MIFMGTQWLPYNKTEEWAKIFLKVTQNPLPSCIKKWQTFSSADGENGLPGIGQRVVQVAFVAIDHFDT